MKSVTIMTFAVVGLFFQSCETSKPQTAKATASAAGPARAVIKVHGSPKKQVGSLFHLSGEGSVADSLVWHLDLGGVKVPNGINDELKEKVKELEGQGLQVVMPSGEEKLYEVVGQEVFVCSYAGTYRAYLSAAAVSNGEITQDLTGITIVVGNGEGDPQPPPKPEPPQPPPSQGFGLTSAVPAWLATVPVDKRGSQAAIKGVLETNARLAADGRFNTMIEIKTSLGAGLSAAIKDVVAWRGFGNAMYTAISKLENAGKISTPQQFGEALSEIARGL